MFGTLYEKTLLVEQLLPPLDDNYLVYFRQKRRYMFLPVFVCLSVCLSVSKTTQKRVHGFG